MNCASSVKDCSLNLNFVLNRTFFLFCSAQCENNYYCKVSTNALRNSLFKLERGICCQCKADCNSMIKRIRRISKDGLNWRERRLQIISEIAPKFLQSKYSNQLNKLITAALDGNAWHADHIIPVYQEGGLCTVENMRTLCVPCHLDVTKKQIMERALQWKIQLHGQQSFFVVEENEEEGGQTLEENQDVKNISSPRPVRKKVKLLKLFTPKNSRSTKSDDV
eukprot:TRINITY_DN20895_c0_g1_i1.p1 TRINITY_DN20895_c0_g1~~TRINITY_DN20895_c0_g1_i1.p1  ORF type:complete len:222 (-),score=27.90 TRINITY_DN20895_c0_g1_i1:286-951(-)